MDRSQLGRRCQTLLAATVASLLVLAVAGCTMSVPFVRNELGPALPANAGVEEVVQRVNANIEHLQGWRSSDLRISGRSLPVHLTGHIAVERPRNFRLTAGALGMTEEADFGSNSEWFWFWVRRGQPNYVFRARHDDMEHSDVLRQTIPFQPDWLIDALGVVPIDPKQVTRLEPGETRQTVNLISDLLLPSGQPVQKVIRVDQRHGVVLGHYLYDARRRLIAKADLDNYDRANGVVMPHTITLEWPQANMQIKLELGQIEVNPTTVPPRMWEVPNKEPLYASFDIGARTRARLQRDNGRRPGRVRLDAGGPSPIREGNSAASDNQFPSDQFPADAAPRSTIGRASIEADNGLEWNKPIEAPADAPDPRASRPAAGVYSPSPTNADPPISSRATSAAAAPRDPFAPDAAWANSQPVQASPAPTSDLIETSPR